MTNYVQTGDIGGTHPYRISAEDDVTDWLVDITSDRVVHMHAVSVEVDSGSLPALKLSNQGLGGDQLEWTDDLGAVQGKVIANGDLYTKGTIAIGGLTSSTAELFLAGGIVAFAPPTNAIQFYAAHGDGNPEFEVGADGRFQWGPGGATPVDTNLYRDAANRLKTDDDLHLGAGLRHLGSQLGFFGHGLNAKQTVTGSRSGNAALNSLLDALTNYGFLTDSTTA